MGVLAGCDARRRMRRMAIPCKQTATTQRARQCNQNVQVIRGQTLNAPCIYADPLSKEISLSITRLSKAGTP